MGYYTLYTITVSDANGDDEAIISRLSEISCYDLKVGEQSDIIKWYTNEADVTAVSKEFPHATIYIEGEGEENGDLWKAKAKAGEYQRVKARIVFDDFK